MRLLESIVLVHLAESYQSRRLLELEVTEQAGDHPYHVGGQTRSYLAKTRFPFFYRIFFRSEDRSIVFSAHESLRSWMSPSNGKIWGIVPPGASRQSTEKRQIGPTLLIYIHTMCVNRRGLCIRLKHCGRVRSCFHTSSRHQVP